MTDTERLKFEAMGREVVLRYGSPSEIAAMKGRMRELEKYEGHDEAPQFEDVPFSKDQVMAGLLEMRAELGSVPALAKRVGLSPSALYDIFNHERISTRAIKKLGYAPVTRYQRAA